MSAAAAAAAPPASGGTPLSIAAGGTPSVKDVMRRVGAYVDAYGERGSIVIATERYLQRTQGSTAARNGERSLVAEFAIVKVDPIIGWQGFRDITEVDGRPVPDSEGRLINSLSTHEGGYAEARRISDESARFNIGLIERNFNLPTSALFFFRTISLDRFKFTARDVRDGIWHITWRETYKPTFIRSPDGASIPATGDLYVDPDAGTILRTVLETTMRGEKGQAGSGQVDVTYKFSAAVDMWVASTMEERWETVAPGGSWARVTGHAEYSNYRQFRTSVRVK